MGQVGTDKKKVLYRYRFPRQEYDIKVGRGVEDPATGKTPGDVIAIDDIACTVDLKANAGRAAPHRAHPDLRIRHRRAGGRAPPPR